MLVQKRPKRSPLCLRVVLPEFHWCTIGSRFADYARCRQVGGKAEQISPFIPSELVADHSVQSRCYGRETIEYSKERLS
jgi:aconitase A